MNRKEIRRQIEEIGIIPSVRVASMDDALFASAAVSQGGIPIVEVHLTVPEAH
jgi:2-keto-3-deoxy-6-phosphogluconate aldolase